jgi:hypothetical protein
LVKRFNKTLDTGVFSGYKASHCGEVRQAEPRRRDMEFNFSRMRDGAWKIQATETKRGKGIKGEGNETTTD